MMERTLSNELWKWDQDSPTIHKKMWDIYDLLETIISSNEQRNQPYRSDVIGLQLNVPLPPPDYFARGENVLAYNPADVIVAD